jgi:hypothetical protein
MGETKKSIKRSRASSYFATQAYEQQELGVVVQKVEMSSLYRFCYIAA